MKYDYLIFDLDGTISDPKQGFTRSINHALKFHGFRERDEDELATFIGPPLDASFASLAATTDSTLINALVEKYRERYAEIGYAENILYPGVVSALAQLSSIPEVQLGICTSKPAHFAEKILELFSIRQHFTFVSGGDVGIEKCQQLATLLEQGIINHKSLMIGDRYIDLTAAHKNHLQAVGVLWGYGSHTELIAHKPARMLSNPSELISLAE
ncbi:MAG: HAD hydrolase-like protein [Pseudomonadales bacterium]|nr:HAD hydrolase-like protein [Pseudomonadales bacterium]